jgi:membrane protein DedA with SNARE-associated domain
VPPVDKGRARGQERAPMHIISDIIAWMAGWIVAVIGWGGYWGIAALMAIESACVPLPSEIIMPFGGYLVSTGQLDLFWVATAGAIGCNIGSIPAYALGQYGGRAGVERFGRYVLMNTDDLDRAERFFLRWGGLAVLICRMLPVVRSFIAFPAGMARMRQLPFHLYTFLGSWPFCWALAWIGMKLGERWHDDPRLKVWFHRIDALVVLALVIGVAWIVRHKLRRSRAARDSAG